ncbi:hypothetical protein JD844_034218 [Phrynosoma platyrhinos]|uniref:Nuclear factor 1 C-type n=1 Tax=Phrynosoma platyrhinos TaxID=52577 RepID=A0ABQ7T8K4_PHRPL|nr:hypothetical protein JD844_034218 [Phrynosoma platyrhinos]
MRHSDQSSSPRTGIGSDQEDSKPIIMLDATDFQENFVTSGVFSVTELIQVSRTPVVTGTGPNFSLGELQGHLAYDLNPSSISPTVKKTEMDKSPFNSPSPQDTSPRLSSFTQHHRPVIAVHSGIARSPHPSSALHFPTTSILPQTATTYFPHTAIRYPPHLNPQDPLKDLVSLACDPSNQQPGPLNGGGQVKVPGHYLPTQMLAPPPPGMPRLAISPDTKSTTTTSEGGTTSPTSPSEEKGIALGAGVGWDGDMAHPASKLPSPQLQSPSCKRWAAHRTEADEDRCSFPPIGMEVVSVDHPECFSRSDAKASEQERKRKERVEARRLLTKITVA